MIDLVGRKRSAATTNIIMTLIATQLKLKPIALEPARGSDPTQQVALGANWRCYLCQLALVVAPDIISAHIKLEQDR